MFCNKFLLSQIFLIIHFGLEAGSFQAPMGLKTCRAAHRSQTHRVCFRETKFEHRDVKPTREKEKICKQRRDTSGRAALCQSVSHRRRLNARHDNHRQIFMMSPEKDRNRFHRGANMENEASVTRRDAFCCHSVVSSFCPARMTLNQYSSTTRCD